MPNSADSIMKTRPLLRAFADNLERPLQPGLWDAKEGVALQTEGERLLLKEQPEFLIRMFAICVHLAESRLKQKADSGGVLKYAYTANYFGRFIDKAIIAGIEIPEGFEEWNDEERGFSLRSRHGAIIYNSLEHLSEIGLIKFWGGGRGGKNIQCLRHHDPSWKAKRRPTGLDSPNVDNWLT